MKKVLHIGLCVYPDRESSLSRAFKKHCKEYVELSLEKNYEAKAMLMAKAFKPDIVFLQLQADILPSHVAHEIKKHSGLVVNWTGDVRQPTPEWFFRIAEEIDVTCFTNMQDVNAMRKKGFRSEFLQIGYDPAIYYTTQKPRKGIVFMGNNYGSQFPLGKSRLQMVNFLQKTYKDKFTLYGHGWQKANGNVNHSQEEEAEIYRKAKIAINYSHFNLERYFSDRLLRIMGTGTTCVSHNYKGWEQDFTDKEIVIFDTLTELKKQVDEQLEGDGEIGISGQKKVYQNFTFDHMVKNILSL